MYQGPAQGSYEEEGGTVSTVTYLIAAATVSPLREPLSSNLTKAG
jgi:hypothetical protein